MTVVAETARSSSPASVAARPESNARTALAGPSDWVLPAKSEFLSFRLGNEEYGIDILRVQEIRSYEQPTRIANAPDFIKGIVNLRGVIVPIVDLRLKLGCAEAPYNNFTVVVVLNVKGRVLGAVVDSVSDVLELTRDQISPAPNVAGDVQGNHIRGIGTLKTGQGESAAERMLILMDIESLMSSPDMGLINSP